MAEQDNVTKLDRSDDFLFGLAERKYEAGDYLGALEMLARRNERYAPAADAWALAADVYEGLGLYSMCADSWFRFLDTCNEADFAEGYEGLAVAFMNMGNAVEATHFYRRSLQEGEASGEEFLDFRPEDLEEEAPKLRLVRSDSEEAAYSMMRGVERMKEGDLAGARETFLTVPEDCAEHASSAGLAAMCLLLMGKDAEAEAECRELYARYPDNIQTLTTYCAVLGARENTAGAQEIARKLAALPLTSTEDMYRVSTALCETGLDEEAYALLTRLKGTQAMRYDENVLWFHAAAGARTGRVEEAIASLELLTTLYPFKAVARYYLEKLREMRDGGAEVKMRYYYRLPAEEYRAVADYFLHIDEMDEAKMDEEAFARNFRLAFDEMEGRDTKLQLLASKQAAMLRADALLREVLLNYNGEDLVKVSIVHDLTMRGEEDSFGTVVCNRYKEFFTHAITLEGGRRRAFMRAFADVYAKTILLDEHGTVNENKLCDAAEDVYATLMEEGALSLTECRSELAAVIYREARLVGGVRGLEEICTAFDADVLITKGILDHMI